MSLTDQDLDMLFRALADPSRRKILRVLRNAAPSQNQGKGLSASDIEQQLSLSQSTISHHMSVLTGAGLVLSKREGLWVWYRRNPASLGKLVKGIAKEF